MTASPDAARLLSWFRERTRDVPWRGEKDPYRIWVAEVMAQQTRMEVVRERYLPFLERFPDVETLAGAERDRVMKAWEGLGYYARARNLHRAARELVEEHGGALPREPRALRRLPGIGAYTAGAIASIAFGVSEPAVDGNARRVLSRLFDLERPTADRLREAARALLAGAPEAPGELNQALMDLGGAVCTPREPECEACPLAAACLALARGTVAERPPRRARREFPHRDVAVGIVRRDGRVLIQRRPRRGLLGGLWEFPGGKVEAGERPRDAVARELREEMGIRVRVGPLLERVDHAYSHLRVTLHAHEAEHVSGEPRPRAATAWTWALPEELRSYAFPAANRRLLDRLAPP